MIEEIESLKRATPLPQHIKDAVEECVSLVYARSEKGKPVGEALAAVFDLLVSGLYYENISNRGWTYCDGNPRLMFYTYTNVCPRCISKGKFVFSKANKPVSAKIGQATAELLCAFYQTLFERVPRRHIEVVRGKEPIDLIIHDTDKDTYLLAEVKAAPLVTLPLAAHCDRITENVDGEIRDTAAHSLVDNPVLNSAELSLYIPAYGKKKEKLFSFPVQKGEKKSFLSAVVGMLRSDKTFYIEYLSFWKTALQAYSQKERSLSLYWLTNACGSPTPVPQGWPKRPGYGFEAVSDAKTSAGMDRTDDIKKGIYQVLKLGAEFKTKYTGVRTAIVSNLPALRHFDEYLLPLKDIVWAVSQKPHITKIADLPADTPVYNLFDGIISLTRSEVRDKWVREALAWQ